MPWEDWLRIYRDGEVYWRKFLPTIEGRVRAHGLVDPPREWEGLLLRYRTAFYPTPIEAALGRCLPSSCAALQRPHCASVVGALYHALWEHGRCRPPVVVRSHPPPSRLVPGSFASFPGVIDAALARASVGALTREQRIVAFGEEPGPQHEPRDGGNAGHPEHPAGASAPVGHGGGGGEAEDDGHLECGVTEPNPPAPEDGVQKDDAEKQMQPEGGQQ